MKPIRQFFKPSDCLEYEVLRPLSHIRSYWELIVDKETGRYIDEEDSFAWLLNNLVDELENAEIPDRYHDSEDQLGYEVQNSLNWKIKNQGGIWLNENGNRLHSSDYLAMLEQGAFKADGTKNLVRAAAGRIRAAIKRGQVHFDEMERSHQIVLAGVLAAILYHRESEEEWLRKQAGDSGFRG